MRRVRIGGPILVAAVAACKGSSKEIRRSLPGRLTRPGGPTLTVMATARQELLSTTHRRLRLRLSAPS